MSDLFVRVDSLAPFMSIPPSSNQRSQVWIQTSQGPCAFASRSNRSMHIGFAAILHPEPGLICPSPQELFSGSDSAVKIRLQRAELYHEIRLNQKKISFPRKKPHPSYRDHASWTGSRHLRNWGFPQRSRGFFLPFSPIAGTCPPSRFLWKRRRRMCL